MSTWCLPPLYQPRHCKWSNSASDRSRLGLCCSLHIAGPRSPTLLHNGSPRSLSELGQGIQWEAPLGQKATEREGSTGQMDRPNRPAHSPNHPLLCPSAPFCHTKRTSGLLNVALLEVLQALLNAALDPPWHNLREVPSRVESRRHFTSEQSRVEGAASRFLTRATETRLGDPGRCSRHNTIIEVLSGFQRSSLA